MIMAQLPTAQHGTGVEGEDLWYAIDPAWYQQRRVSLTYVTHLRRCQECRDGRPPSGKGRRRRSKKEPTWEDEMGAIASCCSQKSGYITAHTPLLEAAFRLLLKNGNQPLSTQEMHQGIQEAWVAGITPRDPSLLHLRRLLLRQDAYGMRRTEPVVRSEEC